MKITDLFPVKEPKPWASKLAPVVCANPDLIVGLEIEVEKCLHEDDWYTEELSGIWQVKTDGSLRGRNNGNRVEGNAFEFISRPAHVKILIPELQKFFETTGITDDNFNDRCSVHVHSNITNMDIHQVGTLFLVYSVVEDLLFQFVNHYGIIDPRGAYRDTNIYCVPWNQCRLNSDIVTKMFNDADYVFKAWQKYTALNILPTRTLGTVEWRHMHGTANVEKLTLWLNLIGQIMKYAKEKKFEDVVKTIKELNDNSAYQQFLQEVLGHYVPFTPEVQKALELGVVNAKYSLMGLKDFTVKVKTAKKKGNMFDEVIHDELLNADVMQWADPFRGVGPQQPQPAPQVAEQAPRIRPVRRPAAAEVLNRLNQEREQREARVRLVNQILTYPVKRGHIISEEHGVEWGVQDVHGLLYTESGLRRVVARFDNLGRDNYCQGVGDALWLNVDANWRPVREGVN